MTTRRALLTTLMVLVAGVAAAGDRKRVFAPGGVAINGYDPVAYFVEGRPVQGRKDLSVKWLGVMWRFASEANRQAFEMDPRAYAPQYGGYCAYGLSHGAIVSTVPEAWRIHEGKLYLSSSAEALREWAADIAGNVRRADANWPGALQD
jgi:hypothetical protein